MSSKQTEPRKMSKAELKFREAFEHLKTGKPDILPKGKTPEVQRDKALGQLLDAQACILELTLENQRLRAQLPLSNVRHLSVPNNLT
tara:strand:+ start:2748 stop:3008 length:261 start_codon:yes stop_codon:yes gene_type:complete